MPADSPSIHGLLWSSLFQAQRGHKNSSSRGSRVTNAPPRNLNPEIIQRTPIGRSLDEVRALFFKKEALAKAADLMNFPIGPWNTFEDAIGELQNFALDHTTSCDVATFGAFKLVLKGLLTG